jgi:hypothetical protein
MKHLKKFNESVSKEDILDNFSFINDKLGQPSISSSKFANSLKWRLRWDLQIDITVLQDAKELIAKLKDITEDIDDVISASDRLGDYNFNMSLGNELVVEIVPKDTGDDTFEFIDKYHFRALYLYKNEIERFFNSYGIRVTKMDLDSNFNEITETNELEIYLSHFNNEANNRFQQLLYNELSQKSEDIDREYEIYSSGNIITIRPEEEKAFVELSYST